MDDLHRRFRRLDRIEAPYLWNEALGRAAEAELIRRPTFNPGMAMIAVALLLAAMAGTVAVGAWINRPSPVRETLTYTNGMIVGHVGCGGLVAVDPTSNGARELVGGADGCIERGNWERPAWSLDGERLAYVVPWLPDSDSAVVGPWLYDAPTGERRQLAACSRRECTHIDISPDGSLVTYLEWAPGASWLVVMEVDSGESHRVPLLGYPGSPVFSPDGHHIALPMLGGKSGIYLVDARDVEDGAVGTPTLLYGLVDATDLAWSPDGEWLALSQSGGVGMDDDERSGFNGQIGHSGIGLVIVRADGTDARVLATGPEAEGPVSPTWSADSSSVAYLTSPRGDTPDAWTTRLWTVGIDGGEPTLLHESDCCVAAHWPPSWSPDGQWIALGVDVADRPSDSGVFLVRPDGSEMRQATNMPLEPVWQPIPKE